MGCYTISPEARLLANSELPCSKTYFEANNLPECVVFEFLRLAPSCCVIFDLEPLSLSFNFAQFRRTSLTGFKTQSVRFSNAYALDSLYLLVLNIGTSQSRQHDMSESDSYYLSD
ncbi:hypothetical protein Tco_1245808 [Tanacetum coccineum]